MFGLLNQAMLSLAFDALHIRTLVDVLFHIYIVLSNVKCGIRFVVL